MKEVRAECEDCGATGLYSGFCGGEGEAVICVICEGSGCMVIKYKPFIKRRRKAGVKRVRISAGRFIGSRVGGVGSFMSYKEFLKDRAYSGKRRK